MITTPAPAPTAPHPAPAPAGSGLIVTVGPSGRLLLADAADTAASPLHRRTRTGVVHRIALSAALDCWLDGDQLDGAGRVNPVATAMCLILGSSQLFTPGEQPLLCGLVLFAGAGTVPCGLPDVLLRRVVEAHAVAGDDPVRLLF